MPRELVEPSGTFEITSTEGRIATPVLDYMRQCIGNMSRWALDADKPPINESGVFVYRDANALDRLDTATFEIVKFDAYPHTPTLGKPELRPFPRFDEASKIYHDAMIKHLEYLNQLLVVLRKHRGAWVSTPHATVRVTEKSTNPEMEMILNPHIVVSDREDWVEISVIKESRSQAINKPQWWEMKPFADQRANLN